MDGTQKGYCSSIIGTEVFSQSRQKIKDLLEGNKCHTYDRFDWESKTDSCANSKNNIEQSV